MNVELAYTHTIQDRILNTPRSLQTMIGPSEIGLDCQRQLAFRLAGKRHESTAIAWKPFIGTAVHAQLESFFDGDEWLTEERVNVGQVGGKPVLGSCDLYHVPTGTVVDHKVVGPGALRTYRSFGPSDQYRIQAHLYGMGFLRAGHTPRKVAISFLPRDGEFHKRYWWSEDWDPLVAIDALDRANQMFQDVEEHGLDAVMEAQEPCTAPWCQLCAPKVERIF